MMDLLGSVSDAVSDALGSAIQSAFDYILYNFVYVVFYYI